MFSVSQALQCPLMRRLGAVLSENENKQFESLTEFAELIMTSLISLLEADVPGFFGEV